MSLLLKHKSCREDSTVTEKIRKCQKCGLCLNQRPLLDLEKECQVFWVGLSAKKMKSDEEVPLSPETNTGMLIQKIEEKCDGVSTYKTNLVKCLPLTEQKKLRYPRGEEIDSCFEHLISEISAMSPQIVFLLGEKVYSSVERHLHIKFDKWKDFEYHYKKYNGVYFIPIHHPSYIYVYKRKNINQYISSIEEIISGLL
jgi:DNA polymerase